MELPLSSMAKPKKNKSLDEVQLARKILDFIIESTESSGNLPKGKKPKKTVKKKKAKSKKHK